MTDELREQLADVQHAIWVHWMSYMFMQGTYADDAWTMPADKVERWSRQMATPYIKLTWKEQESDRHQADKVLDVIAPVLDEVREVRKRAEIAEQMARHYADSIKAWGNKVSELVDENAALRAKLDAVPVEEIERCIGVAFDNTKSQATDLQTVTSWLGKLEVQA